MSEQVSVRVRIAASMVAAFAIAWSASAATTKIKTDYDKTFSFAGLRTWSWHPDGAGDVRLAVSSMDDPKQVARRVDPIIVPAVEREMTARGFSQGANADLRVHYDALAVVGHSAQEKGQFLPAVPNWGVPPFVPSTTALSIFPVGTLIIDISSPAREAIVWRGSAARKIDLERPDSERRKILERAIHDLLSRFPPKK
jgi:hypothetical protein